MPETIPQEYIATAANEPIFRECSLTLSANNCKRFLHAIAMTGCCIKSSLVVAKGLPQKAMPYTSMFFMLRFPAARHLEAFEAQGFITKKPISISRN